MNRRELIRNIALVTGGAVVGAEFLLTGCKTGGKTASVEFTPQQIAMLDEIGETIIPTTTTPGAKAAKIGEYMQVTVRDCYSQKEQDAFIKGVDDIQEASKKITKKMITDNTPEELKQLLQSLEKEAKEFNDKNSKLDAALEEEYELTSKNVAPKDRKEFERTPKHYYTMMKQLTLFGFFTSKTGMTETLRHTPVPGKYDGEFAYNKGDKAWAE